MARLLLLCLLLLAAACGGGGGGSVTDGIPSAPAPEPRHDLLVGFYGTPAAEVGRTAPFANLVWAPDFYPGEPEGAAFQAKMYGLKAVVQLGMCRVPLPALESEARARLSRIDPGVLDNVVGVAWCDEVNIAVLEPAQAAWSDVTVPLASAAVRRAMAAFPRLRPDAKLSQIYACKGDFPGASSFDAVECDDYDSGAAVWSRYYPALEAAAPDASLIVIVADTQRWHTNAQAMLDYANGHQKVWVALGFIAQGVSDEGNYYPGILDDPQKRVAWCKAYQTVTLKAGACV